MIIKTYEEYGVPHDPHGVFLRCLKPRSAWTIGFHMGDNAYKILTVVVADGEDPAMVEKQARALQQELSDLYRNSLSGSQYKTNPYLLVDAVLERWKRYGHYGFPMEGKS